MSKVTIYEAYHDGKLIARELAGLQPRGDRAGRYREASRVGLWLPA